MWEAWSTMQDMAELGTDIALDDSPGHSPVPGAPFGEPGAPELEGGTANGAGGADPEASADAGASGAAQLDDIVVRMAAAAEAAGGVLCAFRGPGGEWIRFPHSPAAEDLDRSLSEAVDVEGGFQIVLPGTAWARGFDMGPGPARVGRAVAVVTADGEPTKQKRQLLRLLFTALRSELAKKASQDLASRRRIPWGTDDRAPTLRAVREIQRLLLEPLAEGRGIAGVASVLARLAGSPVLVVDARGDELAVVRRGDAPAPLPPVDVGRIEAAGAPTAVVGGWLVCPVRIRDHLVAAVCVLVGDDGDELRAVDVLAAEAAGDAVAIGIASGTKGADRTDEDNWHVLCDALIAGKAEVACDVAEALGYPLERARCVALVEGASYRPHLVESVRRGARSLHLFPVVSNKDGRVALVAPHDVDWARLHGSVLDANAGRPCRIGVGSDAASIDELKRSFHDADVALRVSGMLKLQPVIRYDDLGVYALVASSSDPHAIEAFVARWIEPLVEYDRHGRMDLVHTLASYLENGGALDKTAESLCVHRSTLKYRLRRIREIGRLDLDDPDVRFNLQFATRARATLGALRHGGSEDDAPPVAEPQPGSVT